METTIQARKQQSPVHGSIFTCITTWNGLSGIEMVIRLAILLIFAAFFIMPLVWLAVAPTAYAGHVRLTKSPWTSGRLPTIWCPEHIRMLAKG